MHKCTPRMRSHPKDHGRGTATERTEMRQRPGLPRHTRCVATTRGQDLQSRIRPYKYCGKRACKGDGEDRDETESMCCALHQGQPVHSVHHMRPGHAWTGLAPSRWPCSYCGKFASTGDGEDREETERCVARYTWRTTRACMDSTYTIAAAVQLLLTEEISQVPRAR